jgi:hypothetical protein
MIEHQTKSPGFNKANYGNHLTPPKGLRKWVRLLNALLAGLEGRGIKIDRGGQCVADALEAV